MSIYITDDIDSGLVRTVTVHSPDKIRRFVVTKVYSDNPEFINEPDNLTIRNAIIHYLKEKYPTPKPVKPVINFYTLAERLPGAKEMVKYPCDCWADEDQLIDMVIHLNDDHCWPRERTADWLETLGLDLEFKMNAGDEND